jgi:hypothetical protein
MTKEQLARSKELAAQENLLAYCDIDQELVNKLHRLIKAQEEAIIESRLAIRHVLSRIKEDAEIQNRMGLATETFERLTRAAALLFGETQATIADRFITGSSDFHHDRS